MTIFFSLTDLGLATSSSTLLARWLATMQLQYPGYSPSPASLEYVHAQIVAMMAGDLAQLCSQGSTELFRVYGTTLVNVPYQQGVSAVAVISITAAASPATATTTSSGLLSSGGQIGSIPIVPGQYGIAAGSVTLTSGVNVQTWTTTGVDAGASSLPVTLQTPSVDFPAGTIVSGTAVYVLPALTQFALDGFGFTNPAAVSFNASTSQQVNLVAVQTGEIFNGAGSNGGLQTVQSLPWAASVSIAAVATGGVDPEDDGHYLNRLTEQLQLQSPTPITASDYAVMASNFAPFPGTDQQLVGRATAVDGYDPATLTFGNTREVTICVTDDNGFALNADTMYGYPNGTAAAPILTTQGQTSGWGLQGWLLSLREVGFIVNVILPTYSAVYVTMTVKGAAGWAKSSVSAAVTAALLSYLSPASWGLPASNQSGWQNVTSVFRSEITTVIQQVAAVDHVVPGTLAVGLAPSPSYSDQDLALPGPVALPTSNASTIVVTVT